MKILPVRTELFRCGRTDRRTGRQMDCQPWRSQ